jgi:hypothetical protein
MSLTRKDFVRLAKILNGHRSRLLELDSPVAQDCWDSLFFNTLRWLEETNDQFDRTRFIEAVEEDKK